MTNARSDCDYCGLPVAGGSAEDGPRYCCAGCRLAASITAAGGADGQARWLMTRLGLAAFFTMNVMVFTFLLWSQETGGSAGEPAAAVLYDLARYVCLLFSAPVLLLLGGPLLENAVAELRRGRLSIDVLLLAGVAAAFGISAWNTWVGAGHVYYEVACMVLVAVTLGRWLEASGKLRTTEALRELESLLPDQVRRLRAADGRRGGGDGRDVPLAAVAIGDVLRILPGEQVPTDGIIEAGRAALDERTVSGESEPVVRGPGEAVRSGTTNIDGDLAVVVTAPPGAGTLEQLIRAVTAAVRESATQRLADRVAGWFLPAVLAVAAAACGMHCWRSGAAAGVMAALAVVVVSCPCALGLATPLALWAALGRCMRRQVLVRDGDALERLAETATFGLDKTGTLTTGCRVAGMEAVAGFGREAALAIAAGLARASSHQTAAAIAAFVADEGIAPAHVGDARSVAGLGVEGVLVASRQVARLGSPQWVADKKGDIPLFPAAGVGKKGDIPLFSAAGVVTALARLASQAASQKRGMSPFFEPRCVLAIDGEPVAAFWTAEEIRPTAAAAIAALSARGRAAVLLSGDQPQRVAAVADALAVPWRAALVPAEKLAAVAELGRHGGVAMVGDGINDAAALAAADVGIALGCGADVARWSAAICLLDDDLGHLPWLVDLAVATRRTIRWNLLWAFGYNAACIPLAASGFVHPAIAAAAMMVSSLLVVGNSLRLGRDDTTAELAASPARVTGRSEPIATEAGT